MPRYAEVDGVGRLEFPDDTPDEVIGRTVRRLVAQPRREWLQQQGTYARREGVALDLLDRAIDVQTGIVQGATPGGLVGAAGRILGYAGNVAGAAAEDLVAGETTPTSLGNVPNPFGQRFSAAVLGEQGAPSAADTPIEQGLVDAARTLPAVAAGVAGASAGLPVPAAFGAPMAITALEEAQARGAGPGETALAAAQAGLTGALIPGVARAGSQAAARALGAAVEAGWLSGNRTLAQKGAEILAGQGTVQAFMEGLNLPQYMMATPEERRAMIVRNLVSNAAFLAMDVPGLVSKRPSLTQQGLSASYKVGEVLAKAVEDPVAIDTLREATDLVFADHLSGANWAREFSPGRPLSPEMFRPGSQYAPPVPTPPEAVAEQVRLTADPRSTRAVALLTQGEVAQGVPPGLETVETPHGTAIYNPAKVDEATVVKAGQGETFDGRLLGMSASGGEEVVGDQVVTTSTPAARDVVTELVPAGDPAAIERAKEAHADAVPGGTTEVRPAAAVVAERQAAAEAAPAPEAPNANVPPTEAATTAGWYVETDTNRVVIRSSKAEYQALPAETRRLIAKYFLFSPSRGGWVSRSAKGAAGASNAGYVARKLGWPMIDDRPSSKKPQAPAQEKPADEAPEGPLPTFEAPKEEPAKVDENATMNQLLAVPEVDDTQARAFKQALAPREAELRHQVKEAQQNLKILEGKVLNTRGSRFRRGQIKKSANRQEVEAYHKTQRLLESLFQEQEALRKAGTIEADRTIERAATIRRINDPNEPLLRRLALRSRLFADDGQQAPDSLPKALEAEAAKEILARFPDATPDEIRVTLPAVIKNAMATGDADSFTRTFSLDPEANIHGRRAQELRQAYADTEGIGWEWHKLVPVAVEEAYRKNQAGPFSREQVETYLEAWNKAKGELRTQREQEKAEAEAAAAKSAEIEQQTREEHARLIQEAEAQAKDQTTKRAAKDIKEELVSRLETALAEAPIAAGDDGKPLHVVIAVPGDGVFLLKNTKAAIETTLKKARAMGTSPGEKLGKAAWQTTPRPTGNITADIWRDSSEPTHLVAIRMNDGSAMQVPGKRVSFTVPGFVDEAFWLTVQGDNLVVTEPRSGLRIATGETVRKALAAAEEQLKKVGRDKYDAALINAQEGREPLPQPKPIEPKPAARSGSNVSGRVEGSGPGGPLGAAPAQPADNPGFTQFPMELPEAVRMARDLLGGKYPKVLERLRALRGAAAGLFRHWDGRGLAEIELRADIFDLLSKHDKARLREEAQAYAERVAENPREVPGIAEERYKYLLKQAYDEAKTRNPVEALKVIWHEIGHLVDWLPDHMIQGRGNLLGRLASLKDYLRHTLPMEPGGADRPITPADRIRLMKEAERQLREELGPMREMLETILVEEPIYRTSGVTPDQVKALFGMDARESMPELYAWFAAQDGQTKKDIVRKAMKGLVDERLAAFGHREKIGTKTVEKTVRKVSGREPTQAEIIARFRDLLRKEMAARRMADLATLKAELEPLIAWWRGTDTMEEYFRPSPEMYAEAYSVLMNNPAAVARRAPTYYRLVHNYMARKPAVARLYAEIQDQIKSGSIMRARVEELRGAWRRDNEISVERMILRLRTRGRDLLDNVLYTIDRRFGPVFRAAAGTDREGAVRRAVGDFTYRAAEHERFLAKTNDQVGALLMANNLDWHDLGEFLFHQRIIQERFNLANPMGWTSKNSLERLSEMRAAMGPEVFGRLEEAAGRFRKLYEDQVIPLMRRARMWGPELQAKIDANVHYATFAAVRGLPDSGIERALELSFGSSVVPHIYRQIGMLGEVKNPATATVLKSLSLMSAAHRNIVKREIVTMLRQAHPEEIQPAEVRWTGKRREPIERTTDRVGTITYLEDGKALSWYVPRLMAEAVNGGAVIENRLMTAMMRAQSWQKGLFTQLNYGFWPVNFIRDSLDWWFKMPGAMTPLAWFKRLPKAIAAARSSVKGRPNAVADDALRRLMVIAREDPTGVLGDAADEYEAKVASYGLNPAQWDRELKGARRAIGLWNRYREIGQTMERVNKIAGMLYLDEAFPKMPEWQKREIVRERAGSPDFLQRGAWKGGLEFGFLFFNAWKQGLRATINAARENPWSFSAKVGAGVAVPSVLMAAASRGVFGPELEELYRSISDYDLTNYFVVPLGWADKEQRKAMYLRLPLPDPMRVAHGTLFHALAGRGEGIGAFWGGQVPGLNPILQVAGAWALYATGTNPPDLHTGRTILDETTFTAGGTQATGQLAKWSWNSLGGGIIHRFRNPQIDVPPTTGVEEVLGYPGMANVFGRWIKVSNRGLLDEDRRVTKGLEEYRAQVRLAVQKLLGRWADAGLLDGARQSMESGDVTGLARQIVATEMSDAERRLLRDPYAFQYMLRTFPEVMQGRASVQSQRLQRAPSAAARVLIASNEVQRATAPRR